MSRILYIADLNPNKVGSMEEYALFLCRELQRRGHACFLGFAAEPETSLRGLFEEAGALLLTINFSPSTSSIRSIGDILQQMASLYRFIVKHEIELVHINFAGLTNRSLWGVYLTGAKIVFTDHDSGFIYTRSAIKEILSKILHFFISRRVAKYIAVSDYVRNRLRFTHHAPTEKTVTLYNGVNADRFKPGDVTDARNKLGLPLDKHILCSVAMLIPEKGLQHLIEAVKLLVYEYHYRNLMVIVVGEGTYRSDLERLADTEKVAEYVHFYGRRSDVHTIVTAADVVVVPSLWRESFGLIIAEAMASGKPVVASRVGGIPELIEDGTTGVLVDPGDGAGLAKGILAVLQNPVKRRAMADAALIKARTAFNLETQAAICTDLYEEVLRSKGEHGDAT